jgi:hypothetical protein
MSQRGKKSGLSRSFCLFFHLHEFHFKRNFMPYLLNGELVEIGSEPRLEAGTLWVPLRKLGTALGGSADWIAENKVVALYLNDHVVTLTVDDPTADVDGEKFELQAAPFVENGETWVPVRLFERGLGYTLIADAQNGIVDLTASA